LADRNPIPHSISSRLLPFAASITVAPPQLMKQSVDSESVPAIGASALMIMEITFVADSDAFTDPQKLDCSEYGSNRTVSRTSKNSGLDGREP
jgi:hypothetical protein